LNRSLLRPKIQSLLRIRGNHLLDQIRHSDSTHQVRRIARLVGDIAAITSTLTMTLCDIIFKILFKSFRATSARKTQPYARSNY
jgi:hypothetical protein